MSELAISLLWIVGFAIVGSLIGIVVMTYLTTTAMADPNLRLHPASEAHHSDKYRRVGHYHKWAKLKGFRWCGGYTIRAVVTLFIACWEHSRQPAYFCIYVHNKLIVFDIVTIFKDGSSLTTGSSKDSHMLPTDENHFHQSFASQDPDNLIQKHVEAEKFLIKKYDLKKVPPSVDFESAIVGAIHTQMAHVRSHFLWPIRAIYWYMIKRHLMHGIPVQKQNLPDFLTEE